MKNTKNYFITGASRGLGLEFVQQLLEKKNKIWATTQNPEKAAKLLALKEKYPELLSILKMDLKDDQDLNSIVKELGDQTSIDVLINNSGVYLDGGKDFENLEFENVLESFNINTVGPMRVTRALLPFLEKSKNPIVAHITSLMGSIEDNTSGGSYAYRISKAALNMFHKSFSVDHPQIRSIVLHPGWVKTEMGGKQAPTEAIDSIRGMLSVLDKLGDKETGTFYDFEGDKLPW